MFAPIDMCGFHSNITIFEGLSWSQQSSTRPFDLASDLAASVAAMQCQGIGVTGRGEGHLLPKI